MSYVYKPPKNDEAKDKLLQQFIGYCNCNTTTIDEALIQNFWIAVDSVLTNFIQSSQSDNIDQAPKETLNICVTFLRARMAEFDARYRIDLYTDVWFLFKQEYVENWDLGSVYAGLFERIKNARAQYSTAFIPKWEYSNIYIKACEVIKESVFQSLSLHIAKIEKLHSFQYALENHVMKIWVGDYMDQIDLIFTSDL